MAQAQIYEGTAEEIAAQLRVSRLTGRLKAVVTPEEMPLQIEQHIARLKDMDPDVRRSAAHRLGKIGDTSAIPALIEALKDQDRLVRWRVVDALGAFSDASLIPALIKALKNKDKDIRQNAANALGEHETKPETLLRPGQEPVPDVVPQQPTVWQRLFGKRTGRRHN